MKQREIKFRALCLVDCKQGDNITKIVYFTKLECDNGLWFNPDDENIYHINEWLTKPMQFTGLKDKNGVEVYEGDIITCEIYEREYYNEYESEVPIKVSYGNGGFYPFTKAGQWRSSIENIEVIGNIHEHKHLLK